MRPLGLLHTIYRNHCVQRIFSSRYSSGIMQDAESGSPSNRSGEQLGRRGRDRPRRGRSDGNWRRRNGSRDQSGPNSPTSFPASKKNEVRPKLTHFISIPLGHLPALRSTAESFRSALLSHTPPVSGLDPTIIVTPRRLHLTLGVMSLEEEISASKYFSDDGTKDVKTVSSAVDLLGSLRSTILNALGGEPLRIPLTVMDILKPERGDGVKVHVLFVGPSEDDLRGTDGQRLKRICELVNSEFIKSGLIIDEGRPLKLHCTLINTSHRKTNGYRGNGRRMAFSFQEICHVPLIRTLADSPRLPIPEKATEVVEKVEVLAMHSEMQEYITSAMVPEQGTATRRKEKSYAVPINFGTHVVNEIQICRMGSWGPEGEYVCVGKIEL